MFFVNIGFACKAKKIFTILSVIALVQNFFRWEAAKERLKREDEEISKMLKERDSVYEDLFETCAAPFAPVQVPNNKSSGGFFSNLFGSKSWFIYKSTLLFLGACHSKIQKIFFSKKHC